MKVIYDIFFEDVYQGSAWAIGPTQAIRLALQRKRFILKPKESEDAHGC
jgi:hypothetical protein